jgi:hypothetical protein
MAHAPLMHAKCVGPPRRTQFAGIVSVAASKLGSSDREGDGDAQVLADRVERRSGPSEYFASSC